jgi:hypothetical protein
MVMSHKIIPGKRILTAAKLLSRVNQSLSNAPSPYSPLLKGAINFAHTARQRMTMVKLVIEKEGLK